MSVNNKKLRPFIFLSVLVWFDGGVGGKCLTSNGSRQAEVRERRGAIDSLPHTKATLVPDRQTSAKLYISKTMISACMHVPPHGAYMYFSLDWKHCICLACTIRCAMERSGS